MSPTRPPASRRLYGLHAAASDPAGRAGHPAKDRHRREAFETYVRFLLERGGTPVVEERALGRVIGCSRFYRAPDRPDAVSIGFTFLAPEFWGGATNRELERLMLGHAFASVPEVWFHIAPSNVRSQRATAKLGAEHVEDAVLDLAGSPAPWTCWRLTQEAWARTEREARV